jgi:hypothetical protein
MAGAAWREWPWWEYAFISDGSAVAWLSSALLVANAAVALSATLVRALPVITGGCLSAALALLAVDEQFQLHEQFKNSAGTNRFSEAPMVMVGIGAIVVLVLLWRRRPARTARVLFVAAVGLGIFALWVDLGSPPVIVGQLEEGFEVLFREPVSLWPAGTGSSSSAINGRAIRPEQPFPSDVHEDKLPRNGQAFHTDFGARPDGKVRHVVLIQIDVIGHQLVGIAPSLPRSDSRDARSRLAEPGDDG